MFSIPVNRPEQPKSVPGNSQIQCPCLADPYQHRPTPCSSPGRTGPIAAQGGPYVHLGPRLARSRLWHTRHHAPHRGAVDCAIGNIEATKRPDVPSSPGVLIIVRSKVLQCRSKLMITYVRYWFEQRRRTPNNGASGHLIANGIDYQRLAGCLMSYGTTLGPMARSPTKETHLGSLRPTRATRVVLFNYIWVSYKSLYILQHVRVAVTAG